MINKAARSLGKKMGDVIHEGLSKPNAGIALDHNLFAEIESDVLF